MADISKLSGYAVTGASDKAATVAKLSGYAIAGASDKAATIAKLTAYAVVSTAVNVSRPQIAVMT